MDGSLILCTLEWRKCKVITKMKSEVAGEGGFEFMLHLCHALLTSCSHIVGCYCRRCSQVPWVLRSDAARAEDGLWWGHPGRALSPACQKGRQAVHGFLRGRRREMMAPSLGGTNHWSVTHATRELLWNTTAICSLYRHRHYHGEKQMEDMMAYLACVLGLKINYVWCLP